MFFQANVISLRVVYQKSPELKPYNVNSFKAGPQPMGSTSDTHADGLGSNPILPQYKNDPPASKFGTQDFLSLAIKMAKRKKQPGLKIDYFVSENRHPSSAP